MRAVRIAPPSPTALPNCPPISSNGLVSSISAWTACSPCCASMSADEPPIVDAAAGAVHGVDHELGEVEVLEDGQQVGEAEGEGHLVGLAADDAAAIASRIGKATSCATTSYERAV